MFIRAANFYDIPAIMLIGESCSLEVWLESDLQAELVRSDSLLLAADINGCKQKVIGFIAARFTNLESDSGGMRKFLEADLLNLGVLEEHREKGIGAALLKEFINQAKDRGVKTIWLEVRELNVNAVKFYEKNDFYKIQTRKNFYINPRDNAIVMKFDIRT